MAFTLATYAKTEGSKSVWFCLSIWMLSDFWNLKITFKIFNVKTNLVDNIFIKSVQDVDRKNWHPAQVQFTNSCRRDYWGVFWKW